MKKLLFLPALLCLLMTISSCSNDGIGIDFDLKSPDELTFKPGESVTFNFEVSDDTGISRIEITEQSLGINIMKDFTPSQAEVTYSFDVVIPETQSVGSEIGINVDVFDDENNSFLEFIKISIVE